MKKIVLIILMFTGAFNFAQESLVDKKDHYIIYGEFCKGRIINDYYSPFLNTSLNYQKGSNLFKVSFAEALRPSEIESKVEFYTNNNPSLYFSGLYGQRFTVNWFSISVAGGLSYVRTKEIDYNQNVWEGRVRVKRNYKILHGVSMPLEVNIKIFKGRKERLRALFGVIPLTKEPTSLGVSLGMKLFANISKNPFVGLGFSIGIGNHKVYK